MISLDWTTGMLANSLLAEVAWSWTMAYVLLAVTAVALIVARIISANLFAAILILALVVVHQDFWNWGVTERSLGGLPQGFVFHVGLSITAAFIWLIVTIGAWPKDEWNDEPEIQSGSANAKIDNAKMKSNEASQSKGAKA